MDGPREPGVEGDEKEHASRPVQGVAWIAWIVATGSSFIGAWMAYIANGQPGGFEQAPVSSVGAGLLAVACATVGLLLRHRRPDHVIGWLFLSLGLVAGGSNITWGIMLAGLESGGDQDLGQLAAWVGSVVILPSFVYLATALIVLFPDGRAASVGEGRLLRTGRFAALASAVASALAPGQLIGFPGYANPVPLPDSLAVVTRLAVLVAIAGQAVVAALAVRAMVRRYRGSLDVARHQIRWFAYGVGILGPTALLYGLVGLVLTPDRAAVRDVLFLLLVLSATVLPASVLIAITRYRLYDIDRLISRTLVYGALTAILAGLYAASVRLFNAGFVAATGETSEAALVLTTLVLATTFTPIKRRLEGVAERLFGDTAATQQTMPPDARAIPDAGRVEIGVTSEHDPDSDERIEAIVRRVVLEVLEERSVR